MSLFDQQPVSLDEIRQRMALGQEGGTIRKISATGKLYTVRHKPWWMLLGKGPAGQCCKGCTFLRVVRTGKRYFKCGRQSITSGPGTDIRCQDEACRLFQPKGAGAL